MTSPPRGPDAFATSAGHGGRGELELPADLIAAPTPAVLRRGGRVPALERVELLADERLTHEAVVLSEEQRRIEPRRR